MSLVSRINDFALAVAADIKALFARATPAGGAVGQVLTKTSATDYAASWQTPSGGTGDMVLASAQTVSGAKTFNDSMLLLRNVANTFSSKFTNTNTAARTYTLKDANGTIAFISDITGINSGTNTGDNSANSNYSGLKTSATVSSYASGTDSLAASIANSTSTYGAQATGAIAMGAFAKVTAQYGGVLSGQYNLVSGPWGLALGGQVNTASGETSFATGERAIAAQYGKRAHGAFIAASGDNQYGRMVFGASTTGSAAVLTTNRGGANSLNQLVVATNQVMAFTGVLIGKQTGSANIAAYEIKGTLVNNGGVVTMPTGSLTLIGADAIALTAAPTLSADNTNKALTITSGYKAATNIRWSCTLHSTELTYA